jgi:hypothetical protein
METKTLVKQIKAKNRASNLYVLISVMSGIGTALLTVLLVHLLFAGGLAPERIWRIGAGIIVLQSVKAVFNAAGIRQAHRAAYKSLADWRLAFRLIALVAAALGLPAMAKNLMKYTALIPAVKAFSKSERKRNC